jgi:hypothetical protein
VALSGDSLSLVGFVFPSLCTFVLAIECLNLTPNGLLGSLLSSSFNGGPSMVAMEALVGRSFAPNGLATSLDVEKVFRAWSGSYFGLAGCGVRKLVVDGTE